MRLRLNTTLRAALIAAITAVGFTVTQTEAVEQTVQTITFAPTGTGVGQWGGTSASDYDLTASNWSLTKVVGGADVGTMQSSDQLRPNTNVETASGWILSFDITNSGDTAQTIDTITLNSFLFNSGNSYQSNGTARLFNTTLDFGGKTYSTENYTITSNGGANPPSGVLSYTLEAPVVIGAGQSESFSFTMDKGTGEVNGCFAGLTSIVMTHTYELPASLWKGTEAQHTWFGEGSWDPEWEMFASVKFDGSGWNTVTVDDVAMTEAITITGGAYTFEVGADTGVVTNELSVKGAGASLTIAGEGSLAVTNIALGSGNTITVTDGATLYMDGSITASAGDYVSISDTATAVVELETANVLEHVAGAGDVHIAADTLFAGSTAQGTPATTHSTGALIVDQGKTLKIGTTDTGAYKNTYVDMTSFSKVQLDGSSLWIHNNEFSLRNLETTSNGGTVYIADSAGQNNNTLTLAGTTTLNGDLTFHGDWKQKFTIEALAGTGTLKLNGVNHDKQIVNIGGGTVGGLQINNGNVEAYITGDLTVGGMDGTQGTVNVSDGKNLTFNVVEGGNHSFTGTLTVGGQIVKQGTGSQTISGTALHRTLDVQAGTLVLNGNFAIDAITDRNTDISYVDSTGAASTSGFQKASGTISVYDNHSSSGALNLDNGHFTYGVNDVTEDVRQGNGAYTLSGEIDYTTLYVNENTQALAVYQKAASDKGTALAGVVMKDATTLTVDADYSGSISVASGKGNVNISEGQTLTGTKSNITLAGVGTYALNSGDKTLGSGTTLGNDWTGAVRLSGVSMGGENLKNNYAKNSSWVEMAGVTGGYIAGWQGGSEAANIILTNPDGGVAWKWSDGSSSGETLITFSGTWKGAGTFFKDTDNKRQGYKYTGNISGWTGDFRAKATDANAATRLEFAGSATDVKIANIKNEGVSALNVVLSTGGTMSVASNISKTGTGAVNISLTNSTAATLSGTAVADSLTIASGSSLTNTGALTLNGGVSFGNAPIVNNGTVTFGANVVFDLSTLTASGNKYTLFSGTNTADLSGLGMSNIINYTAGASYVFGKDGTISFTTSASKVWTGDPGADWNHTDLTWEDGTPFVDGDSVQFGDEAYVNVGEDVAASVISVEGDSVLYLSATEGAHLSADSLAVGAGSGVCTTVAIDGLQTYSLGEGSSWVIGADQTLETAAHGGLVIVDEGAVVTVNGTSTASDLSGFANDGGTLSVALADATAGDANIVTMQEVDEETPSSGTFELRSGTIDYRSDLGDQTLKLDAGTRLLFGKSNGTHEYAGDIEVAGNASVRSHGTSQHPQVTISGDVTGEGTLTRENDGNQALNFTGTVDLGGYTNNDAQDGSSTVFQGETTIGTLTVGNASKTKFTNESTSIGTITVNGSGTVEFAKSITLSGLTSTGNHALTLNATDSAVVTISGADKSLYKLVTAGDIVIAEGTTLSLGNNLTPNSGTVTVNGTLNLGHEIDLSNNKTSTGKLIVASTGNVTSTDGMWMCPGTAIEMKNGGQFTTKGLTFIGTGDTSKITYGGAAGSDTNYGVEKAVFVITDTAITANQNATIGNKLENSTVNASTFAVTVNNADNTIAGATVGEGGSFTMTGGTLTDTITNGNGTVSLSGITLGDSFVQEGGEDIYVAVDGTTPVTDEDNYYLGNAKGYVTVVTGTGTVSGSNITWNEGTYELQSDGTISTKDAGTDFSTFYLNKDSEQISDILANGTTAVQVNAGTLVVNQDASGVDITVTNEGTITGDHADATQIGIAKDGWAYFSEPVEASGVKFTAAPEGDMLIVNNGETTQKYAVTDRNMDVMAQTLEMTKTDGDVTVSNAVYVDEIVNTTTHALTLDNVEDTLELVNMDITNSTVKVYTDLAQDTEATVSISGVLQGGDATLLANLTLKGGSTLNVNGGDTNALTLGSMLTFDFSEQQLVNLDETTIAALNQLSDGQYLDLIKAAGQTTLSYTGAETGMNYDDLFSRVGGVEGVYTVYAHDNAFGLVKGSQVPEPTTGTLSLLALAALAARRRRK